MWLVGILPQRLLGAVVGRSHGGAHDPRRRVEQLFALTAGGHHGGCPGNGEDTNHILELYSKCTVQYKVEIKSQDFCQFHMKGDPECFNLR